MDNFRIENKQNILFNGMRKTHFTLFEREGDAFICQGRYLAPGHNASDEACREYYLDMSAILQDWNGNDLDSE